MTIRVLKNFSQIVTLEAVYKKDGRRPLPDDIGIIEDGSVVIDDEKIIWVGKEIPSQYNACVQEDFSGKTLLPELVDSHTHLVFGGNRANEYVMRLNGADYQQIAASGGGILKTMRGTNSLTSTELFELGKKRIEKLCAYGIGTIEIKSGYGLTYQQEKDLTLVIDRLKKHFAPRVQIINTYMAAHAVPKEFSSSKKYMEQVVLPLLEELTEIIDVVDIFHEQGYFSCDDVKALFDKALKFNLAIKMHADEFNDNGGARLAASYGALSADHLLMTGADGIKALAESATVATLLPGTGFFLGKKQARCRDFLNAGCKVALASDYNPGSCHCDNLLLIAEFAAPGYGMNIAELLAAITLNSAHALGLRQQGAIVKGLKPRFTIFDAPSVSEVIYNWGNNLAVNLLGK